MPDTDITCTCGHPANRHELITYTERDAAGEVVWTNTVPECNVAACTCTTFVARVDPDQMGLL